MLVSVILKSWGRAREVGDAASCEDVMAASDLFEKVRASQVRASQVRAWGERGQETTVSSLRQATGLALSRESNEFEKIVVGTT